ncbi:MAG: hypothetical protein P8X39_09790 [Desulfofustis sp.]
MHRVVERVALDSTFGPMIIEGDDEHLFSIQFVDGSANEVSSQPETTSPESRIR